MQRGDEQRGRVYEQGKYLLVPCPSLWRDRAHHGLCRWALLLVCGQRQGARHGRLLRVMAPRAPDSIASSSST